MSWRCCDRLHCFHSAHKKTIPVIDAHHHFWDLQHCHYPWLMARGVKRFFGDPTPIQKNYLPLDLLNDAKAVNLVGSVHIQVGVAEEDSVKETEWLQSLHEADGRFPAAIVAFADLEDPDFPAILAQHQQSSAFRGIRQIVGRHPSEDSASGTADVLHSTLFAKHLDLLAEHHHSFDLQLTEAQYDQAFEVFSKVPDLSLVLCHFASPWDQSADGFERWRRSMQQFSSLPNCTLKLSGFGMFNAEWSTADIQPYLNEALELFGVNRLMAGTNFPVDKLYGEYARIWTALQALLDDTSYQRVCHDTAARSTGPLLWRISSQT